MAHSGVSAGARPVHDCTAALAGIGLATIRDGKSRHISSWDRTGGNRDFVGLPAGNKVVLASIPGTGVIRRFYVTAACGDRHFYRTTVLRMYWDGEDRPSVEAPLGDFFGVTHAKPRFYSSLMMSVNPGTRSIPAGGTVGMNCYFPMPFASGARIELENVGKHDIWAVWFHLDYEELAEMPDHQARFHAQWRRENPTRVASSNGLNLSGVGNYVILEAQGQGHYVGCVLGVDNIAGGWYGEGDDMVFVDGERWPPSIHGTGTEEIFGGGACPNVEYAGLYSGIPLISNKDWAGKNGMYRWNIADPIRFTHSIRVTLEHGHANDLANDYSSVAYWYQYEPHAPFPPIPPAEQLAPRMTNDFEEVRTRELRLVRYLTDCIDQGKTPFNPRIQKQADELFLALNHAVDHGQMDAAVEFLDRALDLTHPDGKKEDALSKR